MEIIGIQKGFESLEIYFDQGLQGIDLIQLSEQAKEVSGDGIVFSSIGIYVNSLQSEEKRHEVEKCIDCAKLWTKAH